MSGNDTTTERIDDEQTRVVLLAGEDAWDDRSPSEVRNLIELALKRFTIEPDVVGVPHDGNGAVKVRDWWNCKRARADEDLPEPRTFEPNWPDDDEELTSDEWRTVFQARDEAMMMWATHVVVVEDGDYVGSTLAQAPELGGPIVKTFIEDDEEFEVEDDDEDGVRETVVAEATAGVEDDELVEAGYQEFNQWDGREQKYEGGRPGDNTLL